jgi:hypothetical protein
MHLVLLTHGRVSLSSITDDSIVVASLASLGSIDETARRVERVDTLYKYIFL